MACCLSSPSQLWLFPAWRCEQLLESVLCYEHVSLLMPGGAIRQVFLQAAAKKKRELAYCKTLALQAS